MGMKSIRLASMLSFDEQQEADIIKLIEAFNSSHRMGEFLSNLLRVAVENPELVVAKDGKYDTGAIIKVMEKIGKSPTRHNYMQEINKKVFDMQTKIDEVYDMCLKMYTMAEMGKQLGFEKKTENMILAQFVAEQQLGQLKKTLGVDCANVPFLANRIANYKDRAAGTLEYIISCYEPIINELKNELKIKEIEIPVKPVDLQVQYVPVSNVMTNPAPVSQEVAPDIETKKEELSVENISKIDDNDDDEIDLGAPVVFTENKDELGDLMNFFNDDM